MHDASCIVHETQSRRLCIEHNAQRTMHNAHARARCRPNVPHAHGSVCVRACATMWVARAYVAPTDGRGHGMTERNTRDARTTLARLSHPYWCDDCGRAHDGTRDDAHATLGARGVTLTGHAYAWCEREGTYHVVSPQRRARDDRVTRMMVAERPLELRRATRTLLPQRAQGRTTRRTLRTARALDRDSWRRAQAFARAYDVQRVRATLTVAAFPTFDGGPCVKRTAAPVALTPATTRAIASLSRERVSTAQERAQRAQERARDLAALDARIAARG